MAASEPILPLILRRDRLPVVVGLVGVTVLAWLYLAWVASFVLEVADAGRDADRGRLERLCGAFEAEKPYLLARWRWPDRFNP